MLRRKGLMPSRRQPCRRYGRMRAPRTSEMPGRPLHDDVVKAATVLKRRGGFLCRWGPVNLREELTLPYLAVNASRVRLELFDQPTDAKPAKVIDLDPARNRTGDVWHVWVEGIRPVSFMPIGGWPVRTREGHRFNPYVPHVTRALAAAGSRSDNLGRLCVCGLIKTTRGRTRLALRLNKAKLTPPLRFTGPQRQRNPPLRFQYGRSFDHVIMQRASRHLDVRGGAHPAVPPAGLATRTASNLSDAAFLSVLLPFPVNLSTHSFTFHNPTHRCHRM